MLSRQGKTDEAIVHFRKALAARPAAGEVHYNLALAFESQGNLDEAMEHYLKALDARHTSAEAYYNLGNIMCTHGKLQEAIGQYRKALELDRGYFEAHHNLGNVLLLAGQAKEALLHFQKASELRPQFPEPLSAMARILAMDRDPAIRDTGRAIIFAERAAKLSQYKDARVLETLAFVYAAAGQFDKAGATAQQAATLADAAGDKNLADYIRRQVEAYRQAP
jgi:tetratricopeptide (TPR) repeat protein